MEGAGVFLDGYKRVQETLHFALKDMTPEELVREPHPPIGWLAWRATRTQDSQICRLSGGKHAWIDEGWHARFNMPPVASDYGTGLTHTREMVAKFRSPDAKTILDYHDVVFEHTKAYLLKVTPQELDRVLNEPQFTPLPTVEVRLMSILVSMLQGTGQILYLKGLLRRGGWFPKEGY